MTVPQSIDSNITGLAYAEETSFKVLPGSPIWYGLEPNTYSDFGATFTSVARETINATRQRLKGTITDESAKGGFNVDMTQRNLTRLMQGFFFADALEKPATQPLNGTQVPITSVSTTQYLAAAGLGVFLVNHLIAPKNFSNSGNNGLKQISAVAAGAITITGGGLTAEASPPATAQFEVVGIRGAASDLALTVVGALILITSTTLDFTTLALNPGEWVFIGGDAAANHYATAADIGYARISTITAHVLTFDFTSFAPVADAGTGKLIDIYFGKVVQNAIIPTLVKRRTYQLERTLGDDGTGTQSEYLTGSVADSFTLNMPTAAKITADLGFISSDIEDRTGTTGIKGGTRVGLPGEAAYNTTHNVFLSRLAVVDPTTLNPTSLYGFVSTLKLDIKNEAAQIKAIGVLGGFNVSTGDFTVSGTLTAYFATTAAVAQIRAGANVALQTIVASANAGFVFDLPLLTLGGGANKIVKDKPIEVDLTQDAAKCPAGYTCMACFWEYLPTAAMPV